MGVARRGDDRPAPSGVPIAPAQWGGPLGPKHRGGAGDDGFFASRCKAEGGGKKLAAAVAGRTIEAQPVFGQTQSIRGRRWGGTPMEYRGTRQATPSVCHQERTGGTEPVRPPEPTGGRHGRADSGDNDRGLDMPSSQSGYAVIAVPTVAPRKTSVNTGGVALRPAVGRVSRAIDPHRPGRDRGH